MKISPESLKMSKSTPTANEDEHFRKLPPNLNEKSSINIQTGMWQEWLSWRNRHDAVALAHEEPCSTHLDSRIVQFENSKKSVEKRPLTLFLELGSYLLPIYATQYLITKIDANILFFAKSGIRDQQSMQKPFGKPHFNAFALKIGISLRKYSLRSDEGQHNTGCAYIGAQWRCYSSLSLMSCNLIN